ncbi:MAG: hypothetical protein PHQ27_03055, partial [Victivallales bacterium]|nr:hypothetical protein [Victivallales bacterium]
MQLLISQEWKDFRYCRVPLLIFWLLLVTELLSGLSMNTGMLATFISAASVLLQQLLLLVLIPMLIQSDPPVGDTAFWLTRPITPCRLFAAKAAFLVIAVILPQIATELLILAANGIGVRYLLLAIPEILLDSGAFIVAVATVAALTRNFARYALAGVLVFIVMAVILPLFGCLIAPLLPTSCAARGMLSFEPVKLSLIASKNILATILLIVGGIDIMQRQYRTRQTKRSFRSALVLILLIFITKMLWPWDFMAGQ